jgi:hypothetical protein
VNVLLIVGELVYNCDELVQDYPSDITGDGERKDNHDQDGGGAPEAELLQPIDGRSPDETQDEGKGKRNQHLSGEIHYHNYRRYDDQRPRTPAAGYGGIG